MNNVTGKALAPGERKLAGLLLGLGCTCALLPAIATAGEPSAPTQPSETRAYDQSAALPFEYLNIAGSTFHPVDNSTSYSYPGTGCIAKTGGSEKRFVTKVILPQGAVARYMRLYYYNTSARKITAFFTTYDAAGNYQEVNAVDSLGGPSGYGSVLSTEFNHTVDRYARAINVLVNLDDKNDSTLQFCGVRITYDAPLTDRIFANGFELTPL